MNRTIFFSFLVLTSGRPAEAFKKMSHIFDRLPKLEVKKRQFQIADIEMPNNIYYSKYNNMVALKDIWDKTKPCNLHKILPAGIVHGMLPYLYTDVVISETKKALLKEGPCFSVDQKTSEKLIACIIALVHGGFDVAEKGYDWFIENQKSINKYLNFDTNCFEKFMPSVVLNHYYRCTACHQKLPVRVNEVPEIVLEPARSLEKAIVAAGYMAKGTYDISSEYCENCKEITALTSYSKFLNMPPVIPFTISQSNSYYDQEPSGDGWSNIMTFSQRVNFASLEKDDSEEKAIYNLSAVRFWDQNDKDYTMFKKHRHWWLFDGKGYTKLAPIVAECAFKCGFISRKSSKNPKKVVCQNLHPKLLWYAKEDQSTNKPIKGS